MSRQFGWITIFILLFFSMISLAGIDKKVEINVQHAPTIDSKEESLEAYIILDYIEESGNVQSFSICELFSECKKHRDSLKKEVKNRDVLIAKSVNTSLVAMEVIKEPEEPELDPNGKYIALTFDDGPSPNVTPRILDILKEKDIKATFFMLGLQVEKYPIMAKKVAEEGHEIGNHSYSHSRLTNLEKEKILQEIEGTNQIIKEIIGEIPISFRPPYGAYNQIVQDITFEKKEPIILWSVDSLDWKNRNAEAVVKIVLDNVKPGSIVLLHDIHPTTADALPSILSNLIKDGYKFISISELLTLDKTGEMGPYYSYNNQKK